MKNFLMFLSIMIISTIAYVDAKDRLNELDSIAANTPAQIQMRRAVPVQKLNPVPKQIQSIHPPSSLNHGRKLHEQSQDSTDRLHEKQESINTRRKDVINPYHF